ncbi:hypothetical protein DRQ11_14985, partial [candidate division KSB1 bacterium]
RRIMVDVAIDQGGNFDFVDLGGNLIKNVQPTYHSNPVRLGYKGLIYYLVANMPGKKGVISKIASQMLEVSRLPYLKLIIQGGWKKIQEVEGLQKARSIFEGKLIDRRVAESLGLEWTDLDKILKKRRVSSSSIVRELVDKGSVFLRNTYEGLYVEKQIQWLKEKYKNLKGLKVLHINTTKEGGGVAELLGVLIPLSGKVGIEAGWEVFEGSSEFFNFTKKKLHNGLQGNRVRISEDEKDFYKIKSREEFECLEEKGVFKDLDIVICHDPQTAGIIPLIRGKYPHIKVIWRCHIDLSSPDREVWKFIREFVCLADRVIFHMEEFVQKDLPCEKIVIMPASINPLSPKNREIPQELIRKVLERYQINPYKPIILQASRFDPFKGQENAMRVFEKVREDIDCQLVLASNFPRDDAEGLFIFEMFKSLRERYKFKEDIHLIRLESEGEENALEVNALQRAAYLVVHLAQKEGFGLVVTEAMWKKKPVIATECGGIKLQIENGKSGFLVENREEAKSKILQLFENTNLARRIGEEARKRVRKEFLTTKHLERYLKTFKEILSSSPVRIEKEIVSLLRFIQENFNHSPPLSGIPKKMKIARLKRSYYEDTYRGGSFKRERVSFTSPWLAGRKIPSFFFFHPSFSAWKKESMAYVRRRIEVIFFIPKFLTVSPEYLNSSSSAIEISIDEVSLGLLILFNRPLYIKDIWRW